MLVWLLITVFSVSFLLIQKPSISVLWLFLIIGLFLLAALLNLRQLRHNFLRHPAIFWHNNCWYLQDEHNKSAISIEANTRVLPHWVLLEFKPSDGNILSKKTLFLPKDAMSDKDYRDLCRTLRFVEQDRDTSIG